MSMCTPNAGGAPSPAVEGVAPRQGRRPAGRARPRGVGRPTKNSSAAVPPALCHPPVYPVEPHALTYHGDTRVDSYYWMASRSDARLKPLVARENAALEQFFTDAQGAAPPLRRQLFREMRARWNEEETSLPTLDRSYWYYTRHVRNAEYPLFCRRPYNREAGVNVDFLEDMCALWRRDPTAAMPAFEDEIVFLDVNLLVRELKLPAVEVGEMDISPDESELAVTLDCSGGKEIFTLFVVDIRNVNYARWLAKDADAMQRAWARELERTRQSVYVPLTPSSLASSSPAGSPLSAAHHYPSLPSRRRKGLAEGGRERQDDQEDEGGPSRVEGGRASFAASPRSPSSPVSPPTLPPPHHSVRHRIDIFDLSSEVLWVSPTAVVYLAVDERMRPYQLVYHDLSIADAAAASVVCYEEDDDAFWVGSVCFSSDDSHVLFCSSSTEVSEWFAVPLTEAAAARLPPFPPVCEAASALDHAARARMLLASPEVYACNNRTLQALPIAQAPLLEALDHEEDRRGGTEAVAGAAQLPRDVATVLRFTSREECAVDYDLDHHCAFLGPDVSAAASVGAWLMTGNAQGSTNHNVFFLPDRDVPSHARAVEPAQDKGGAGERRLRLCELRAEAAEAGAGGGRVCDLWRPLFHYDELYKVESVENFYHFLLIAVRRGGHPTTLFCPIAFVWRWWAAQGSTMDRKEAATPALRLADLADLSELLSRLPALREGGVGATAPVHVCSVNAVAEGRRVEVWPVTAEDDAPAAPTTPPSPAPAAVAPQTSVTDGAALAAVEKDLHVTPLRSAVECYPGGSSYYAPNWRMSVSHLLHPRIQLQCEFHCPHTRTTLGDEDGAGAVSAAIDATPCSDAVDGAAGHCSSDPAVYPLGTLRVRQLRREVVGGDFTYAPDDYDGAVVWVPSDYDGSGGPAQDPHPSPVGGGHTGLPHLVPTHTRADAVRIPVTLCWRRDCWAPGRCPMVLHAYGGYGECYDPDFSTERLSLLDRGLAWGYAAVRGGGELGIPWRDAGRKLQRGVTVNDYVSVARYLQDTDLCAAGRLIACGGSAGGIPVCRALTLTPHLFLAVIGNAPFVDCLTSLLDDDMPLSVTEREECGDPVRDPAAYHLLKSLSPVDTVEELARRVLGAKAEHATDDGSGLDAHEAAAKRPVLPHVLLQTSWEDTRVGYWEPLKLVAALRARVYGPVQQACASRLADLRARHAAQPDGYDEDTRVPLAEAVERAQRSYPHLHLCCDSTTGHSGSSGRYEQLREIAREYAFILTVLGHQ